jgi:hypothetical protein
MTAGRPSSSLLGRIEDVESTGGGVRCVGGGQPISLPIDHTEAGVSQPQGLEDALAQEGLDGLIGGPLDQDARHI